MNIENAIKDVITSKLEEGIIEKLVAENLEKGINNALDRLFGCYGDVTKLIEGKIKSVMIEDLERYDYSKYLAKLDHILTEILKNIALDNKKILENFKELMNETEFPKLVKLSDIFEQYKKYVAKYVSTSNLEVNMYDTPSYEAVTVSMEVEEEEDRSWSIYKYAKVVFECKEDEDMNCEIRLRKYRDNPWELSVDIDSSIKSLRHLDYFRVYLLKLSQSLSNIEIDSNYLDDEVTPEEEPEASY